MKLEQYIDEVRQDLRDVSSTPEFDDDDVTRALSRAIYDLNRWVPREKVVEFTIDGGTQSESVDVGTKPSTVTLAKRLIRASSEVVSIGATTYTRDTDYVMDYTNGTITFPTTSTIANSATVTITYSLANIAIDIASLTDFV